MRAIIVEDELASRETLQAYLSKYCEDVEVIAEAATAQDGIAAIHQHRPDLVFLDVEMPFGNAFDLLEGVDKIDFEVIFVTAYSQYAMQALNCSAAYYLLKPLDIDELVSAVEKVKARLAAQEESVHTRVLLDNIKLVNRQRQKVVLPVLDGFEVVQVQDIVRCQAQGNFTDFIMAEGKKRMICRTLKFYEEVLTPLGFARVHKSHLVNLDYVVGYKKGKGGQLALKNGDVVDVSPARKQQLLDYF
ncbi:MAG: LytTR family DNA-binding domain-containing protein [Bacteroidota bacterium]